MSDCVITVVDFYGEEIDTVITPVITMQSNSESIEVLLTSHLGDYSPLLIFFFTFFPTDLALSNKLVSYDLENQTIGWTEYDCKICTIFRSIYLI